MDIFEDFEGLEDLYTLDVEEFINVERHPYTLRDRTDHFTKWDDKEFRRRFRLSKATVRFLLQQIEPDLRHRSDRNHPVSPEDQLLVSLKFLASGCFYIAAGDFLGIHKSTVGKIVPRVLQAILGIRERYIHLPGTLEERQDSARQFAEFAKFPRVIGAIDCTHVKLLSPGGEQAELFRNRKGFMSLNVQVVCNAGTKIIDIVARWPGSTHDNQIFSNSSIRMKFENGNMGNFLLVGDSGYPVKSYLMTPLANPQSRAENLYNESQIRTRNVIERTFGIWKRRFPILSSGIRCRLPLAQQIITDTAILHNLALDQRDELPDDDQLYADLLNDVNIPVLMTNQENDLVRRNIINYFH